MLYLWLIPLAILLIVLLAMIYNNIMKRPRTPEERAQTPHQHRY